MVFPVITADNQDHTSGGIIYSSLLAQKRWKRKGIYAINLPGTVTTESIADGAIKPSKLDLAVVAASTPPLTPSTTTTYLVTSPATGAFAGHENDLATWDGAVWTFTDPYEGIVVWDSTADKLLAWNGTAWVIANEYTPPAIPDVPANRIRGNLTNTAAPEGNFTAEELVDWLQANPTAFNDLKASVQPSATATDTNSANINFNLIDRDLSAPPGSPAGGTMYYVKPTGTGAWAGHDNEIAIYDAATATWSFVPLSEGRAFWVADEDKWVVWDGTQFKDIGSTATGTLLASEEWRTNFITDPTLGPWALAPAVVGRDNPEFGLTTRIASLTLTGLNLAVSFTTPLPNTKYRVVLLDLDNLGSAPASSVTKQTTGCTVTFSNLSSVRISLTLTAYS
jgi:hypothetical protein